MRTSLGLTATASTRSPDRAGFANWFASVLLELIDPRTSYIICRARGLIRKTVSGQTAPVFTNLPVGSYQREVSANGFETYIRSIGINIGLHLGQVASGCGRGTSGNGLWTPGKRIVGTGTVVPDWGRSGLGKAQNFIRTPVFYRTVRRSRLPGR